MDQYSRGYNPNWYSHKYNQDNKNGNNSKINKNTYDLKQKSDYNYYNRSSNSKSGYNERSYDYNNGNIGLSRDSKDRIKYYEPEGSSNQWNSSSNSSSTSNRNSFYRPNQRLSSGLSMKKIESITSEQSLPRSNSVPKLNSSTLGYFKTPNRIDINSHTRTYTSEKYYDEKPKENYLTNSNSKTSSDNTNKFDQEFPALGATKKTETPKFSRPYSQNYSITGSNLNNNSGSSTNTWSNSTSQTSNNGYKSYNSIVNNRLSNGNSNLSNGNASRTWDKKSNSYDSPQSQRTDSTVSSPYDNSNSTLSSIVSQSIKNNGLASNNYSSNNYSNENSYNNQNQSVGTSYNGSNTNSLSSTPTPITSVSVNGGFAAAAAVSSTINTNVESSNSELMKLRQLVPKVSSQSSRSKNNYSRAKANQTRPLATQNRRSTTPVGLKISLSSDVINSISSSKLHTSAPSSPKSTNNSSSTPTMSAKHKNKSSSKFFKELRKLGLSNNSKSNQEDKNDNNSEMSEKSTTVTTKESRKYKADNSEISEKNTATITDNVYTSSDENALEEEEKLRNNNEEIIITDLKDEENEINENYENDLSSLDISSIPIQESHNKIKSSREKYFAVPYSASLEKEEQFMASLGWNKQQYGYEDSDVEDGEWEITDEEKIKFYNIFNNDCKNIFKTLEPKTKNNLTRKCLECSTCFACPFPCSICGSILLESGGLNNRMIHLHKHSKNNPSLLSQISTIDDSLTDSENNNSLEDKDIIQLSDQNSSKDNEIKQHHHVCQIHNENHYKNEQNQMNTKDDEEIFELK